MAVRLDNPTMESAPNGDNVEAITLLQLRDLLTYNPLAKRQTAMLAIPTTYLGLDSGPSPGTVIGIVIGSVAGFLLLLWFFYSCFDIVNPFDWLFEWFPRTVVQEEVIQRRSTSSHHRSRSRHETVVLEE
jgi:hypothetical protein